MEIIEEIALVVSKSLRKSRPCWDITRDVKAWSVDSRWVCVGMKNEAMRSRRIGGGAMEMEWLGSWHREKVVEKKYESFKLEQN